MFRVSKLNIFAVNIPQLLTSIILDQEGANKSFRRHTRTGEKVKTVSFQRQQIKLSGEGQSYHLLPDHTKKPLQSTQIQFFGQLC